MSDTVLSARDTAVNKTGHFSAGTGVLIGKDKKKISNILEGDKLEGALKKNCSGLGMAY